ncbi:MAG TPA: AraC family transcriptional regulator [Polyangiaceae bacterium]
MAPPFPSCHRDPMSDGEPITSAPLAAGALARLADVRCRHRAHARPEGEVHADWTVALVRRGEFLYRPEDERSPRRLREGWLFLGRAGMEYECRHEHDGGDDCLSLHLDPALLEDAAREAAGRGPILPSGATPPIAQVSGAFTLAARALARGESVDVDDLAVTVAGAVVATLHDRALPAHRAPSPKDEERVRAAIALLEAHPREPWPLGALAARVGSSPFHFARAFRAIAGVSPHQYLIGVRLRRAIALLVDTVRPVTEVAYDVGFEDLSNFVRTFHRQVGRSPRAFRAASGLQM